MSETFYDYIIIGAGVAGIASAQYAARSGLKTLVIDSSGSGGQALLIVSLENYPGLVPPISGMDFSLNMKKQAEGFGATFVNEKVSSIDKIANKFSIKTNKTIYSCYAVLIATGAEHRALGVPGEKEHEGRGVSYCATCDGPFFKGKNIFVVGGGDSACDEAMYLSTLSDHITLVHRRAKLRATGRVANRVLQNPKITVRFNSDIKEIRGNGKVEYVILRNVETQEETEVPADAVFVFVGMLPKTDLVQMLPKDEAGYIKTNDKMETAIKGFFAAGDVRAKPFRQVVTATADGAIAAHEAFEYIGTVKD